MELDEQPDIYKRFCGGRIMSSLQFVNRKYFPQTSYFHYGKVPCSTVKNNSPCDYASMEAEKEQFLRDFAVIFGDKSDDTQSD